MNELLNNCGFAIQGVKRLYIASIKLDGTTIDFPLEYNTITGTSDSIIRVDEWDSLGNIIVMGGQTIEYREIKNYGDNISFEEDYQENRQGKTYVKKLEIYLNKVDYLTNSGLKEFIFTANGEFAISNAIAFIVDNNNNNWIIGYDLPLVLQDGMEVQISEDNYYKLTFESTSVLRIRNFSVINAY